jgi:hypothetical protein
VANPNIVGVGYTNHVAGATRVRGAKGARLTVR